MLEIVFLKLVSVYGGPGLVVRNGIGYNVITNFLSFLAEEKLRLTCELLNKSLILIKLLLISMFQAAFVYMLVHGEFRHFLIFV